MQPLVSVIIPVYNAAPYLTECLDGVCAQTLRKLDIICVDDGSTDGSPEILRKFAAKDERIRVLTQTNQGEAGARRTGIAAACGEWLGFVDSDDIPEPDLYERLLKNALENQADISHCGMLFFYPDGRTVPHFGTGTFRVRDHDGGLEDLLAGRQVEPSMCNKLYRASLVQGCTLDFSFRHQVDMLSNYVLFDAAERVVYEDFCGYRYRRRKDSVSSDWQSASALRDVLTVREEILRRSQGKIRGFAERLWLSTLVNALNQLSFGDSEDPFYEECRSRLRENAASLGLLSRKQHIAAKLHLRCPFLAKAVYRFYGRISLFCYEH